MIIKSYLAEQNIKIIKNKYILFYGENLGLKNEFKKKIKNDFSNYETLNYYQDEVIKNENLLLSEISNTSLFSTEKIIFLNEVSDKILKTVQTCEDIDPDQRIILFAENLDRRSKLRNYFEKSKNFAAIACYQDNRINISNIIREKLKGFEGLNTDIVNLIIDNCKLDRVKLLNELDKIGSFFKEKKLNIKDIEDLLNLTTSNDFNALKDAAFLGNRKATNKLLSETILETEKNVLYLNIINQNLNKIDQLNKIESKDSVEKKVELLKPPIFWKDKENFINQVKRWDNRKLKKIKNETYNYEIKIKSNSVLDKNILLKKLIIDICKCANS